MSQRRDQLRAADIDRTFVADLLKKAVDEGRLSLTEYDERLQRTYEARTYGDLDKVIGDLPRPSRRAVAAAVTPLSPDRTAGWQPQPPKRDGNWLQHVWGAWAIAVAVNTVIWVILCVTTLEWIYPWPLWVAGPWGVVLLAGSIIQRGRRDP